MHKLKFASGDRVIELDEKDFPLSLFLETVDGEKVREIKLTHARDERGFKTDRIKSAVMN